MRKSGKPDLRASEDPGPRGCTTTRFNCRSNLPC